MENNRLQNLYEYITDIMKNAPVYKQCTEEEKIILSKIKDLKNVMERLGYSLGYTIVYYPWDGMEGKPRVAGRFKTAKEKDEFLEKIHKPDSGWLEEELSSVHIIDDYNYRLSR